MEPSLLDEPRGLYGPHGLLVVETQNASWLVPPDRGLLMPTPNAEVIVHGAGRHINLSTQSFVSPAASVLVEVDSLSRGIIVELDTMRRRDTDGDSHAYHLSTALTYRLTRTEPGYCRLPWPESASARRLLTLVARDPGDQRSLAELADEADVAQSAVRRAIREETQLTYRQWRARARVQASCIALADGLPGHRIVADFGYADASTLTAAFRRETGLTPTQFRHLVATGEPTS